MKHAILFVLLGLAMVPHGHAKSLKASIRHIVDSFYQSQPNTVGIILHVESPQRHLSYSYAAGYADKNTQQKLEPLQPVLLASNTKTYISAAILMLVECKAITLDQPIESLISDRSRQLLTQDGYALKTIHVRHLLSHTSGIHDYATDAYFDFVDTHPRYRWTRDEQISLAMEVGKPLGQPTDTFKYADINYLLLTEIIERFTNKPFYLAVRELLNYSGNGLYNTWFAGLDQPTLPTLPLAHQYWDKRFWDASEQHPSWDLYGGGGIIATAPDLARFFQHLFEGKIIRDKQLLAQMYTHVPCKATTNYCLGVRKLSIAETIGYYHGGFWGTDAIYFPSLNTSIAIFILERGKRELSAEICKSILALLKKQSAAS